VAAAVTDITPPGTQAFHPVVIVESPPKFHIDAADSHALAGHAGEVGLAAGDDIEPAVEHVIPDVPLRLPRGVHRGDEVDGGDQLSVFPRHLVGHVHDELHRPDTVERGQVEMRQSMRAVTAGCATIECHQARTAVCGPGDRTLLLGPAQGVESERRPMVLGLTSVGDLVAELEQVQVAGEMRAEAADLDIIAHEIRIAADVVRPAGEELFLIVETRAPGQAAADLDVLAHGMAEHVLRTHALGRVFIVQAAGGMDVVVAAPVAMLVRIDPAFDLIGERDRLVADDKGLHFRDALRSVRAFHRVIARGKVQGFSGLSIDLTLEKEVRSQPFRLRGIDAALAVTDLEGSHARRAVGVLHVELHRCTRDDLESHRHRRPVGAVALRVFQIHPVDVDVSRSHSRIEPDAGELIGGFKFHFV